MEHTLQYLCSQRGLVTREGPRDARIWRRTNKPYPADREHPVEPSTPQPPVTPTAHGQYRDMAKPQAPARELRAPVLLAIVESPEAQVAITADGEIVILDGATHTKLPRRVVRPIARLIRRLDTAGLLDDR